MFGNKTPRAPRIELSKLSSLIGPDIQVSGDIRFSGGLRIDGRVTGNVIGEAGENGGAALLVLSRHGVIEGSLRCAEAVIDGAVTGDIVVERFIDLQSNARVQGTLRYEQLRMEVGAVVQGELLRAGEAPAARNVVELAAAQVSSAAQR
jgi:cytoskeletal protein CcmA (bactofilin family)